MELLYGEFVLALQLHTDRALIKVLTSLRQSDILDYFKLMTVWVQEILLLLI